MQRCQIYNKRSSHHFLEFFCLKMFKRSRMFIIASCSVKKRSNVHSVFVYHSCDVSGPYFGSANLNVFNPHLLNPTANEQKVDEFRVYSRKSLKKISSHRRSLGLHKYNNFISFVIVDHYLFLVVRGCSALGQVGEIARDGLQSFHSAYVACIQIISFIIAFREILFLIYRRVR
jgi:hypothetical protein